MLGLDCLDVLVACRIVLQLRVNVGDVNLGALNRREPVVVLDGDLEGGAGTRAWRARLTRAAHGRRRHDVVAGRSRCRGAHDGRHVRAVAAGRVREPDMRSVLTVSESSRCAKVEVRWPRPSSWTGLRSFQQKRVSVKECKRELKMEFDRGSYGVTCQTAERQPKSTKH